MLGKLIKRGKKRCRPMWQKVLFGGLWTLCGLILFSVLYGIWFFTGKPTLSVDYLARLNEMMRPVGAAGENAWADYEKAIGALVSTADVDKEHCFPAADWPEDKEGLRTIVGRTVGKEKYRAYGDLGIEEQAAIAEWVDRNEEAWGHFVEASRKDYCFHEYVVEDEEGHPMLLSVLLPNLSEIRDLARMGVWRSEKLRYENKPEEAAGECLTVIRSGFHWQKNRGTLIEQLVGMAMVKLGLLQMIAVVEDGGLSSEQLAGIQKGLGDIFAGGFPQVEVESEQLMFEDCVQHSFTDGGPGGGHIVPQMLAQLAEMDAEELMQYTGAGLIHAGRDKTLALGEKLYDHMEKVVKTSPYERKTGKIESAESILEAHGKWRYAFLWALCPAIERVGEIRYQGKAVYDATLAILAVKRWEGDKGALPESLEQLKEAGYIESVPDDPYSAGKLIYAVRDGDFVLYSVGDDFEDGGGVQNPDDVWGRDEEGGDRVFWPVE